MGFFDKPEGVGAKLNVYMFSPKNLIRHFMTAISQPKYFLSRMRVMLFQMLNPDCPWLTAESIKQIDQFLKKDMVGLEWGSGRSTRWFAKRLQSLISVEHNEAWYNSVRAELDENTINNVDYRYVPIEDDCAEYVRQIELNDEQYDFVLVDGECRYECLAVAAKQMKKGGYLVLDNADLDYGIAGIDMSDFKLVRTDNGVWRTDIYIYSPS